MIMGESTSLDRTPVHIKRNRSKTAQEQRAAVRARRETRHKLLALRQALTRRRIEQGDVRSLAELVGEARRKKRRKQLLQDSSQSSRLALSPLEALPPELIEQIFLSCLECNLPLASAHIAAVLSREAIYRLLIRLAFFDPPERLRRLFLPRQVSHGSSATDGTGSFGDATRRQLQKQVLRLRWCTFDRLRAVGREVFQIYADECWHKRRGPMDVEETQALDRVMHEGVWRGGQAEGQDEGDDDDDDDDDDDTRARFFPDRSDNQMLVIQQRPCGIMLSTFDTDEASPATPYPDLRTALRFPCRLLCVPDGRVRGSPWTLEKVRFLRGLLAMSSKPSHPLCRAVYADDRPPIVSPTAMRQGIGSAVSESNVEALTLLLRLAALQEEADEAQHGDETPAASLVDPRLFSVAIGQPDALALLRTLIRFCPLSFPQDDPDLTNYAMDLQEADDPFGEWLLDYMVQLPADAAAGKPLFTRGRLTRGFEEQDRIEDALVVFGREVEA
ncbi:hypothetical protein KEM52_003434 [Ascosphaera acerosa]|nr:hypothetical protein KEM52_003434 [Ascosphaera acerosa]